MKILILGGTVFLGRHLVDSAVNRGHDVTIYHRGNHPSHRDDISEILGDRTGDLSELNGEWDAVLDTSGYLPVHVKKSVSRLGRSFYCFVSSISVYADFSADYIDEESSLGTMEDPDSTDINKYYGPLKALCEREVATRAPRNLIVRPGLIVGPHDPSDRFTYWPARFSENDRVLCPSAPDVPVQFIDARDLADWIVSAAEEGICGVYNATGPKTEMCFSSFAEICSSEFRGDPVYVSEKFLKRQGISSWTDLPMWIAGEDNMPGHSRVDSSKAYNKGLVCRPVESTLRDTLDWRMGDKEKIDLKWGMSPEKEKEVLELWAKG